MRGSSMSTATLSWHVSPAKESRNPRHSQHSHTPRFGGVCFWCRLHTCLLHPPMARTSATTPPQFRHTQLWQFVATLQTAALQSPIGLLYWPLHYFD